MTESVGYLQQITEGKICFEYLLPIIANCERFAVAQKASKTQNHVELLLPICSVVVFERLSFCVEDLVCFFQVWLTCSLVSKLCHFFSSSSNFTWRLGSESQ
jgi:hypothetical protein